jgi:hypothetical protein
VQAFAADVEISEANFPDPAFRAYVIAVYDINPKDGELSEAEADVATVSGMDVQGRGIANMKGIEYFPNLTELICYNNQLTSLDVSKNLALKNLGLVKNQLTSLDVSKNSALEILICNDNQLTSLDVSKNSALKDLRVTGNQLSSLDVSKNSVLERLECNDNQLTSLNVNGNPQLWQLNCNDNQLSSLDVSNCSALQELYCDRSGLTSLDVSKNPKLRRLNCSNNQFTSLDVSKNLELQGLYCDRNQLSSLDVSGNPELQILRCHRNALTSLDVSKNSKLQELFCLENRLTSLDVSKNPVLEQLSAEENQLLNIVGLSGLIVYRGSSQQVIIPVSADPANPGSYLSRAAFSFAPHTITLDSGASFNVGTGKFSTNTPNTPIAFTTDNGSGQTITGTITFSPPSPSKDITSFILAGAEGTISGTAISVTVPYGTKLSSLVPTITHTGVSISPAADQPQDFRSKVTYTVTAEDGSTQGYTVTVTVAPSALPPTGDTTALALMLLALLSAATGGLILTCWLITRKSVFHP